MAAAALGCDPRRPGRYDLVCCGGSMKRLKDRASGSGIRAARRRITTTRGNESTGCLADAGHGSASFIPPAKMRVRLNLDGATTSARPPRASTPRCLDERHELVSRADRRCVPCPSPPCHRALGEPTPIASPRARRRADRVGRTELRCAGGPAPRAGTLRPRPSSTSERMRPVWRPLGDGATPTGPGRPLPCERGALPNPQVLPADPSPSGSPWHSAVLIENAGSNHAPGSVGSTAAR
jgi:hypothetical protein